MKRHQFGLRFFLIGCLIAGVLLSLMIRFLLDVQRFNSSIEGVYDNARHVSGLGYDLTSYLNHRDEPVAYVLRVSRDDVDRMSTSYGYDRNEGGILAVDGQKVVPGDSVWLFVNGPYGHTNRIELTDREAQKLMPVYTRGTPKLDVLQFWRDFVEPKIYKLSGRSVKGQREGPWEFRLNNGALYLEGSYKNGARDGRWVKHYPNGKIRLVLQYDKGQPVGTWTYHNEAGEELVAAPYHEFQCLYARMHGEPTVDDVGISTPELPADVKTVFPLP